VRCWFALTRDKRVPSTRWAGSGVCVSAMTCLLAPGYVILVEPIVLARSLIRADASTSSVARERPRQRQAYAQLFKAKGCHSYVYKREERS
jgi:hypothetical protein